jgi:transposase
LEKIWADGAYAGERLAGWLEEQGGWESEIVERDREARDFEVLPKLWIVERTFSSDFLMVDTEPALEQRLRAAGAN